MINSFFKDLKVVELASVLAGPAVGMFFAELGAKVIKVENQTTGGDVTRNWKLPTEDKNRNYSAYYCSVNWKKEVLFLNLKSKEGRQFVYEMIKESDVVLTNFKKGSAEKLGMDYKKLSSFNDRLIYAELTGFPEGVNKPAFDIVLQAETGFLFMTGEANRNPVRMPVALIDLLAAHQLKEAILMALLQREKAGKGAYVSTSLFESAIASLANQATNWLMEGHIPQRMGSAHPNISPYGDIFYTKDNKLITLAVGTEKQFKGLCESLGIQAMSEDKRFKTNVLRVKNREALKLVLKDAIAKFNRKFLNDLFEKNGVPAGNVNNMKEVFELPYAKDLTLEEHQSDGGATKRVKTVAFKFKM